MGVVEQIIWSAGSEAELQRIEQRLRTHYPSTYTNTLNGITFVDGVDPDENRVLIIHNYASELRRCGDLKLSRALFAPGG